LWDEIQWETGGGGSPFLRKGQVQDTGMILKKGRNEGKKRRRGERQKKK